MSAMNDVFVPEWKRELIRKKQMWKNRGGWSVPPVARPQSDSFVRVTDGFRRQTDVRRSTTDLSSSADFDCADDDYEDVFPLVKTRSAENILDDKPSTKQRRVSSTIPYENQTQKKRPVPKMEDFFKKYRKTPTKKTATLENKVGNEIFEKSNWKQSIYPLYFVDMNRNELPPPDTVKKTVKAFEGPKDSTDGTSTSDMSNGETSADDGRSSIRDVVNRFEAVIRSASQNPQSKSPTAKNDVRPIPVARKAKHVTFDTDVRVANGVFNVSVNGQATIVDDGQPSIDDRDDMKTVTINANQSIVIKTV